MEDNRTLEEILQEKEQLQEKVKTYEEQLKTYEQEKAARESVSYDDNYYKDIKVKEYDGIVVDEAQKKELIEFAKSNKLDKDIAEKFGNILMDKIYGIKKQVDERLNQWGEETKQLLESNKSAEVAIAKAFDVAPSGKELRAALTETGFDKHPAFAKFMAEIGEKFIEKPAPAGKPASDDIGRATEFDEFLKKGK